MDRQTQRELTRELERWKGVTGHRFEHRGKHYSLIVSTEKGSKFLTFSATPSDGRALKNRIADLRKLLRGLGAEKE